MTRLLARYEIFKRVVNVKGSIVECGVFRGGCAALMAHVANRGGLGRKTWLFDSFEEPTAGYAEKCYYHDLAAHRGQTCAAIVNPEIDEGFGAYVRFDKRQLPQLVQWKMIGRKEYVCGVEPCSNRLGGAAAERKAGRLITLRPGASCCPASAPWC